MPPSGLGRTAATPLLPLPLQGVRAIDLTTSWAGPKVGQLLGDLGAEVIKVEAIQWMDAQRGRKRPAPGPWYPQRDPGQRPWDRHVVFNQLNRNKLGITLNLKHPEGREFFRRLAAVSDVVVDCFAPRVMESLGLGYGALSTVNPALVVMSMPGFGMTGPYRDYVSWGNLIESVGGQVAARGHGDAEMTTVGAYGDPISGLTGAFALLVALYYRSKTGRGQFIDLSQAEAFLPFSAEAILDYALNGRLPARTGNRHPSMAPHGVYRCRGEDAWIAIAVEDDAQWEALCRATDHAEWREDGRFADGLSRWRHQDDLDRLVEEWTRDRSPREAMGLLQAAGVPAGAVLNLAELHEDPHLRARGRLTEVTHPQAGTHRYAGPTWRSSAPPPSIRLPAPCLGQHNHQVLGELLGLSREQIQALDEAQVIGTVPLDSAES